MGAQLPGRGLLALTPADFDFEAGTVKINKSYHWLHKEDVITSPKPKKSNRTIKMPDFLRDEMKDYLGMFYGVKKKDRIFSCTKSYLHTRWTGERKRLGLSALESMISGIHTFHCSLTWVSPLRRLQTV